ncbi:MAG: AI-2E family transporter, partial [Rhizobiaceae bacterium]|nr:AI-2E family transporter [Rhizobiaceae bacterium]
ILTIAFAIMVGWLLSVGRSLVLPIILAAIAVYVLSGASEALKKVRLIDAMPGFVVPLLLLAFFTLAILALALIVGTTIDELIAVIPTYQDNLQTLIVRIAALFNINDLPNWNEMRELANKRINLQSMILWMVNGLTNLGSMIFVIIVYALFLVSERLSFQGKLEAAFPGGSETEKFTRVSAEINQKISNYLALKTLINIILGTVSYLIMLFMGVDFALFWAIIIGFLNYIPYFGSLLGVLLPVVLSLAQFASFSTTLTLAILLTTVQIYIGNVVEPRWIGRELNLSPFVVLVALSFWTALWGLPGAILAIPLTSIVVIILSSFEQTRSYALLAAERAPAAGIAREDGD